MNPSNTAESAADQPPYTAVVGIGASAGGISPLQTLLKHTPADTGMVFVIVMHLDPERESGLPAVLQHHTRMPVIQVQEKTPLQANHVYVIPPNKRLLATEDSLEVADLEESRLNRVPIDHLFRSLASTHSSRVFGIILSGSGTDGAIGLKQIKEGDGFVMVQAPDEAEFESMPRAAIATGIVDLVLPVIEISRQLVEMAKDGGVFAERPEKLAKHAPEALRRILSHLQIRVGHDFSNYKAPTILRRIGRRMQVKRVRDFRDYLKILHEDESNETEALFNDLLIGVTTFFRDRSAWDALAENVIPKLFEQKQPGVAIRVWAAGCSSGEEAYSLAILLLDEAEKFDPKPAIQIFASDIDDRGLGTAREGVFPEGIQADVPSHLLNRHFIRDGNHYRAKKALRESVIFAAHDLLRDPPFSRLDLITCRNLLIYLEREAQSRIFEIFHYALRPGGYLFLGSSESLGESTIFKTIDKPHRLFQARERRGDPPHLPILPLKPQQRPRQRESKKQPGTSSEAQLHRYMLEHYAPPSILVDETLNAIHISESAGRYLNPAGGTLSHDITKLVRSELRMELRAALRAAFHEDTHSITKPIGVKFNGTPVPVSMMVRHNPRRTDSENLVLVVFLEGAEAAAVTTTIPPVHPNEAVSRLATELERAHEQLQATVEDADNTQEELRSANEELQSMNEEYRSTTEELETSREELQSVNEELNTVNNELQSKLDEISEAHNDLQNLMATTDIGTLFLDRELCLKRYTPRIHNLFNIMQGDIGRPISHFTHAFDYDDLIPAAKRLLEDLQAREAEVKGRDGAWYLMRMRPYRTMEDRIEGIVVTFIDITERRKAEEALRESEEGYRILLENVREYAIFMMDVDRHITTWNAGAERIFGYTEEEAIGQTADFIFTDEDRAAGIPGREMKIAEEKGEAADDRPHRCKDGSTFWANGILAALYDKQGKLRGYAKVLRDNTDRKFAEDRMRELNDSLEARVKERTKQVRTLASTLTMAEQEERRRISRILHDNLQQLLYSVQMKLTLIKNDAEKDDRTQLKIKADKACCSIGEAIETTRQLTVDLSPPVLKGEGLRDALHWLVSLMQDVHEINVTLISADAFLLPNEDMRVLLFQIVRELLFNVVKHGCTNHAKVELEHAGDNRIRIQVSDEGKGFDVAKAEQRQEGFGLFAVRERLNLLGGRMEIDSIHGKGTCITIVAPLEPGESPLDENPPKDPS